MSASQPRKKRGRKTAERRTAPPTSASLTLASRAATAPAPGGSAAASPLGAWLARWSWALLPALAAALAHAPVLWNGFVYDDEAKVRWLATAHAPLLEQLVSNRGLTHLLHRADYWLWGPWAPGFHLTNLVLHVAASVLVAGLARTLLRDRLGALACGLLFAVHPVHVEAVASFVNRKDILAAIFVVLALLCWLEPRRRWSTRLAALLLFGLAVLAKEVAAVGLVGMVAVADAALERPSGGPPGRRLAGTAASILPFATLGALAAVAFAGDVTARLAPRAIAATTESQVSSYGEVLAQTLGAALDNARLLLFPVTLSADYPLRPGLALLDAAAVAGATLLAATVGVGLVLLRRHPVAGFGLLWTVVMYVPVSNVVPLTRFFLADRYLYVPSVGACLVAGALARRASRTGMQAVVATALAVLVVLGGARTFARTLDWRDGETLWRAALRSGASTVRVHTNLGIALGLQGRHADALPHFDAAIALAPDLLASHRARAAALRSLGRHDEAAAECAAVVARALDDVDCRQMLGEMAMERGDRAAGEEHFRAVLRSAPLHGLALTNLAGLLASHAAVGSPQAMEARSLAERAVVSIEASSPDQRLRAEKVLLASFMAAGDYAGASRQAGRVLDASPRDADATHVLADVALRTGRTDDAVRAYRRLLLRDPEDVGALVNLAALLSRSPGSAAEAVPLAEQAVALTARGEAALHSRAERVLVRTLVAAGRAPEAAARCPAVLRDHPDDPTCRGLVRTAKGAR